MINKVILSLLEIRSKKEPNDYLIAGSGTFFMLWLNVISLIGLYFIYYKINFIAFFVKHQAIIWPFTIIGFLGFQFYARYIHKKYKQVHLRLSPPYQSSYIFYSQ